MAGLQAIELEGYRSIRAARVELGAINVLIGANGAGKSNLLGALGLLAAIADRRLQLHVGQRGGAERLLRFGRKVTERIRLGVDLGGAFYEAILAPTGEDALIFEEELAWLGVPPRSRALQGLPAALDDALPRGHVLGAGGHRESAIGVNKPRPGAGGIVSTGYAFSTRTGDAIAGGVVDPAAIAPVLDGVQGRAVFHFHDTTALGPLTRSQDVHDAHALRRSGENLAPVLLGLSARAPGAYRRIVEAVRAVAPYFDDFVLAPSEVNPDVMALQWRHVEHEAPFPAAALSDGTLRFICLATLLLQPEPPATICIDEPELGLHPFAIHYLMGLVRAAAARTQIVLATQSVTLLDEADPADVIVADLADGGSRFQRLDLAALAAWRAEYSLGQLWRKNVLGGGPA